MHVKKDERKEIQIAKDSIMWEYNLDNEKLSIDAAILNGRFPDDGRTINHVCQEYFYIISGIGTAFIEDEGFQLNEGDVFIADVDKKYYIIGENLNFICVSAPKWHPEQQEIIKGE